MGSIGDLNSSNPATLKEINWMLYNRLDSNRDNPTFPDQNCCMY